MNGGLPVARSMTGYGVGTSARDGLTVTVELRGVNNRFLDQSIKTPRALIPFEGALRDLIQARLSRGRISVFVTEEWSEEASPEIRADIGRAKRYLTELRTMTRDLGIPGEVCLEHLLSLEDLFRRGEDDEYRARLWEQTQEALHIALDGFIVVADREGATLAIDLETRLKALAGHLETVRQLAAGQVAEYRQRLLDRLQELLSDDRLDKNRLETEVAIAADRLDITEEIVRLGSHLDVFAKTLKQAGPIGKSLGFVQQEMGREANTIASKAWSVDISHISIQMKELLEQIREQIQNIE